MSKEKREKEFTKISLLLPRWTLFSRITNAAEQGMSMNRVSFVAERQMPMNKEPNGTSEKIP